MAYCGINPRWSFSPLSGEGAALYGGRFNPKGVPALYFGTTPETAFLEATQGFAYKFSPLTMCSFEVDCDDIVDLTGADAAALAAIGPENVGAPWKWQQSEGMRPDSWRVYDQLKKDAAGVLVPSFASGAQARMTNLVLWNWSESTPHKVSLVDPEKRLPQNDQSWTTGQPPNPRSR